MSTKRKPETQLEDKRVAVKPKTLPSNLYDWHVKWTQILVEASPLLKDICAIIADFMPDVPEWTPFAIHRGMTVFDKKEGTWLLSTPNGVITETYVNDVLHGPRFFGTGNAFTLYENGMPIENRVFVNDYEGTPVWMVRCFDATGKASGRIDIEVVE